MDTMHCKEKQSDPMPPPQARYPDSMEIVFRENPYESILDSNIFSAYIPEELDVPRIDDPRKTQASDNGAPRHPGYVRSAEINQIFTYIGFVKRNDSKAYKEHLPALFQELNRFLRVFEQIVFSLDVAVSEEIYMEQKAGMENFLESYGRQERNRIGWIEKIWKQQKNYLENMDMILEALKLRGRVFDCRQSDLYRAIVGFCEQYFHGFTKEGPSRLDCSFVANCCAKASTDHAAKTIWSGDLHIAGILKAVYRESGIKDLPEIFVRASYAPRRYARLFP